MDCIHQINISKGGVPKKPVKSVYISKNGLVGDKHRNKKIHGGRDRAVSLFSIGVIEALQNEGHPIFSGSTGENLTIRYQDYFSLYEGKQLQLGEDVLIELTSYAEPCKTISASFLNGNFGLILQQINPGYSRWYAKVIQEGWLQKGDLIK